MNLGEKNVGSSPGVSNLQPMGHMHPRMAVNVAQHKVVNLLKGLSIFCDYVLQCI